MLLVPLAESSSPPLSSSTTNIPTTPLPPSAQPNLTSPLFPVNIEQDIFCDDNGGDEMKDDDVEVEEEQDDDDDDDDDDEEGKFFSSETAQ
jgi:hypothetical protein